MTSIWERNARHFIAHGMICFLHERTRENVSLDRAKLFNIDAIMIKVDSILHVAFRFRSWAADRVSNCLNLSFFIRCWSGKRAQA